MPVEQASGHPYHFHFRAFVLSRFRGLLSLALARYSNHLTPLPLIPISPVAT
jgi:hypothetical protein